MKKIFICTSFSTKVDTTGLVVPEYRAFIEPILIAIKKSKVAYFCALEACNWQIVPDADATSEFLLDLKEMETSDILLALVEEDRSVGVQTEIGYFLKLTQEDPRKKIFIAHSLQTELSWTNKAVCNLPGVQELSYGHSDDICKALLAS